MVDARSRSSFSGRPCVALLAATRRCHGRPKARAQGRRPGHANEAVRRRSKPARSEGGWTPVLDRGSKGDRGRAASRRTSGAAASLRGVGSGWPGGGAPTLLHLRRRRPVDVPARRGRAARRPRWSTPARRIIAVAAAAGGSRSARRRPPRRSGVGADEAGALAPYDRRREARDDAAVAHQDRAERASAQRGGGCGATKEATPAEPLLVASGADVALQRNQSSRWRMQGGARRRRRPSLARGASAAARRRRRARRLGRLSPARAASRPGALRRHARLVVPRRMQRCKLPWCARANAERDRRRRARRLQGPAPGRRGRRSRGAASAGGDASAAECSAAAWPAGSGGWARRPSPRPAGMAASARLQVAPAEARGRPGLRRARAPACSPRRDGRVAVGIRGRTSTSGRTAWMWAIARAPGRPSRSHSLSDPQTRQSIRRTDALRYGREWRTHAVHVRTLDAPARAPETCPAPPRRGAVRLSSPRSCVWTLPRRRAFAASFGAAKLSSARPIGGGPPA